MTNPTLLEILENIVYPIVGQRCNTRDLHEFPDLDGDERCLVCTMYDTIDESKQQIIKAVEEMIPEEYDDYYATNPVEKGKKIGYNEAISDMKQALKEWGKS